jgi:hypothetical protein
MKKIVFLFIFCAFNISAFAQIGTDSVAYQLERTKINTMLAQRTVKFGQYDRSLSMHTGIFGLQTKKDIRNSNDILMDIVKTDDAIYKELKILLEFKTFQQTQVLNHSKETEQSTLGYMTAINKLHNQIDQLKADADKYQQKTTKTRNWLIILSVFLLASLLYLLTRKSSVKA